MAKVAMPLAADFEDVEFRKPFDALRQAGHDVVVLGMESGKEVRGKRGRESVNIEATPDDVQPEDFDAVVIAGGYSPDHLRLDEAMVDFVRRFEGTGKLIASVCHGPQLLIEAGVVRGRTMTSWPSVKTDLENAGATWVDREVVQDGNFISSRGPQDLDAFSSAILERTQGR